MLTIPGMLSDTSTSILAERIGANDVSSVKKILKAAIFSNAAVVIPMGLFLGVISPWLMRQYGEGFENAWPVLLVVIISCIIRPIIQPFNSIISAAGKMWYAMTIGITYALILVSSMLILKGFGAMGLAISFLISDTLWVLLSIIGCNFVFKEIKTTEAKIEN